MSSKVTPRTSPHNEPIDQKISPGKGFSDHADSTSPPFSQPTPQRKEIRTDLKAGMGIIARSQKEIKARKEQQTKQIDSLKSIEDISSKSYGFATSSLQFRDIEFICQLNNGITVVVGDAGRVQGNIEYKTLHLVYNDKLIKQETWESTRSRKWLKNFYKSF